MGWRGAVLPGLRQGHLTALAASLAESQARRLPWKQRGWGGCQVCWRHGSPTLGMRRRWDLGSGAGRGSSILSLPLAVPTWIPAALGLACHHTGSILAADCKPACCLEKPPLPDPSLHYRWEPIYPNAQGRGREPRDPSLQPASAPLMPCPSCLSALPHCAEALRPGDGGQLPFHGGPGPPKQTWEMRGR